MSLAEFIPDSDYRFTLGLDRRPAAEFFRPSADHEHLLGERRHWLSLNPTAYAAMLPEGVPLLEEVLELTDLVPSLACGTSWWEKLLSLGRCWEPDFVVLSRDREVSIRLLGGCVCFPSSWALGEKIGRPIEQVHAPVPMLNRSIGKQIQSFLHKLRPGVAWMRSNWGLSRSSELNQHPEHHLPALDTSATAESVWFRVERQALVALPRTKGILFGIRVSMFPLARVREEPEARRRLIRALETMPDAVAQYKGIRPVRAHLISLLNGGGAYSNSIS